MNNYCTKFNYLQGIVIICNYNKKTYFTNINNKNTVIPVADP